MGNVQQYCGSNCLGNDHQMDQTERKITEAGPTLNDYHEHCWKKVVNAWRNYKIRKNNPNLIQNFQNYLKKLDENIKTKGNFITEKEFERNLPENILKNYKIFSLLDPEKGVDRDLYSSETLNYNNITYENKPIFRKPVLYHQTNEIYLGYWNNLAEREGIGMLITDKGNLIFGKWIKGNCIFGRLFFHNGTHYKGQLIHYQPNGKGKLFYNDFCIYDGEWLKGEYNGQGILEINNLCKYSGSFKNSVFWGLGNLSYQNLYEYEGTFENNKFSRNGELRFDEGDEYSGSWKNGKFSGKGVYKWKSGNIYEGGYEEGKKKGHGKLLYKFGKAYFEGLWSNGKPNGKGIVKYENVYISGTWKLGKLQQIDDDEQFKKLNNDESKLFVPYENENISGDNFKIEFVTPYKENPEEILNDSTNARNNNDKHYNKFIFQGIYNNLEKQNVFKN